MTPLPSKKLSRRFYRSVGISAEFGILLDDRPALTRGRKARLILPNENLAALIAEEWHAQEHYIDPSSMPLTRLANIALDRVAPDHDRIIAEFIKFAANDLVCYRAADPCDLVLLQKEHWDRIIQWATQRFEKPFLVTTGIMPIEQDDATLAALKLSLMALSSFVLCALYDIAALTRSSLISLMLAEGDLSAQEAWCAAHLEEDYQRRRWGADAEALRRHAYREQEFNHAYRFLAAC